LMLVDYAETRLSLASMLRAVADDSGGRLRVLLLARGAGEWWAQLEASSDACAHSQLLPPRFSLDQSLARRRLPMIWCFRQSGLSPTSSESQCRIALRRKPDRDRCRSWCCTPQPFWQCWMQRNTTKPPGRYRGVITPQVDAVKSVA
jgi:hypothetical protein